MIIIPIVIIIIRITIIAIKIVLLIIMLINNIVLMLLIILVQVTIIVTLTMTLTISKIKAIITIIRVPFFLPFGFNQGTQKENGQKGTTTQEPRHCCRRHAGQQLQCHLPTAVFLTDTDRRIVADSASCKPTRMQLRKHMQSHLPSAS